MASFLWFDRGVVLLALFLSFHTLQAQESRFKFEGLLGAPVENINNMNSLALAFIPYNPVVVEVGAYRGQGTAGLAKTYPYGRIYAFEPHPEAYSSLAASVESCTNVAVFNLAVGNQNGVVNLWGSGTGASLLKVKGYPNPVDVHGVVLDDWCREVNIDHIDFLRLDANGFELKILQSSPHILKTVLVVVAKTHQAPRTNSYAMLKRFLEHEGFELLSHWYEVNAEGEATFVRKYMYDALFR